MRSSRPDHSRDPCGVLERSLCRGYGQNRYQHHGQNALRIRVCRDKTLASETILYVRVCGRDYYGWLDGSPAIGYRIHFSGSLFKDWWQVDRRGFYSRASYRRLPSETWGSAEPGSAVPTGPLDVVDFSQPCSPDSSWPG